MTLTEAHASGLHGFGIKVLVEGGGGAALARPRATAEHVIAAYTCGLPRFGFCAHGAQCLEAQVQEAEGVPVCAASARCACLCSRRKVCLVSLTDCKAGACRLLFSQYATCAATVGARRAQDTARQAVTACAQQQSS